MHLRLLSLLAAAAVTASATAQITYVDADPATNLSNADGTAMTLGVDHLVADSLWFMRPNPLNGGSSCNSNDSGVENSGMLRQTITGLVPGADYDIYFYLWAHPTQLWRGRAVVGTTPPVPEIQGFVTTGPSWSSDVPMKPLAYDSFNGQNGILPLGLNYNASYEDISGHFANTVVIREAGAMMFEGNLGRHTADANGEIWVYVDDHPNGGFNYRTWFDGVGYELAPATYGPSCGDATIDMSGHPVRTTDWTINLANADAGSLAALLIGFAPTAPFDLGLIGWTPGCYLNVDFALLELGFTDANGAGTYAGNFASLPSTTQIPLYWQWAVFDFNFNLTEMTAGLETIFHY